MSGSKWYSWDGIEFEMHAFKKYRKFGRNFTAHFLYGDTSLGVLPPIKFLSNFKSIYTLHACPSDFDEIFQKKNYLHFAEHLIILGENQRPLLHAAGIGDEKITYIPHGVDTYYFKPPELPSRRKRNRVLIIGNWRRNFNFYYTLVRKALDETDLDFLLISNPDHLQAFDGMDDERVICRHDVDDDALLDAYQTSGMMLLSVKDAVANNVVLESLASGLPVVAENIGAIPEYLPSDSNLFTPRDMDEAIQEMLRIRNLSYDEFRHYSSEIRAFSERYDWEIIANKTKEVYQKVAQLP